MNPTRPLPRRAWRRPVLSCLVAALVLAAMPVLAQETVVPKRSVRTGYAQVLRVEPVYQTLTATRMEQRCNGVPVPPADKPHGLSRIVGAVKEALGGDEARPAQQPAQGKDCELVPVERKFQRPIAYDVDYVYRGMKYRSRLPYDPGNRLRVQFSLQPVVPDAGQRTRRRPRAPLRRNRLHALLRHATIRARCMPFAPLPPSSAPPTWRLA